MSVGVPQQRDAGEDFNIFGASVKHLDQVPDATEIEPLQAEIEAENTVEI